MVRTDTLLRAILGVDALGSAEDQEREVQTATCLVELMKQLMSLRAVLTRIAVTRGAHIGCDSIGRCPASAFQIGSDSVGREIPHRAGKGINDEKPDYSADQEVPDIPSIEPCFDVQRVLRAVHLELYSVGLLAKVSGPAIEGDRRRRL